MLHPDARRRRLRRTLLALIFSNAYSSSTNLPPSPLDYLSGGTPDGFGSGLQYADSLRQRAHEFIIDAYRASPVCSWRMVSNTGEFPGQEGGAWNILFPDDNSIYHVTIAHIKRGQAFKISSDELPYARYFSFQTYDALALLPTGAITDNTIKTIPGTGYNNYVNASAADAGAKQGGYEIYVTPDGKEGYENEIRGLYGNREEGDFMLFMRLYDVDHPPESFNDTVFAYPDTVPECWTQTGGLVDTDDLGSAMPSLDDVHKFGWACPPQIQIKQNNSELWEPRPRCAKTREDELGNMEYNKIINPGYECDIHANHPNNFYLPNTRMERGELINYDAEYLMACAETKHIARDKQLWARVTSVLPRTPKSLYEDPIIASAQDNDLRYFSISTVNRSPPGRVAETIKDEALIEHYTALHQGGTWDRHFTVWIGPENATLPVEAELDNGLVLRWPTEYGEAVPWPGIIYRQILAQSQVIDDPIFTYGIADIIADVCPNNGTHRRSSDGADADSVNAREETEEEGKGMKRHLRGTKGGAKANRPGWIIESIAKEAIKQTHHFFKDDDNWDPFWVDDDDVVSEDDWIQGGLHHCKDSDERCCGSGMVPKCCRMTGHVREVLQEYYPEIVYFSYSPDEHLLEAVQPPQQNSYEEQDGVHP